MINESEDFRGIFRSLSYPESQESVKEERQRLLFPQSEKPNFGSDDLWVSLSYSLFDSSSS